jgi:hypothetical protein
METNNKVIEEAETGSKVHADLVKAFHAISRLARVCSICRMTLCCTLCSAKKLQQQN